jgi:hypothetical protein
MIDIDRVEGFSPFHVWARGGQAPLRAQATLLSGPADCPLLTSGYGAALRPATLASQTSLPAPGSPQLSGTHGPRKTVTVTGVRTPISVHDLSGRLRSAYPGSRAGPGHAGTGGDVPMVTVIVTGQAMNRAIATYWQAAAAQT